MLYCKAIFEILQQQNEFTPYLTSVSDFNNNYVDEYTQTPTAMLQNPVVPEELRLLLYNSKWCLSLEWDVQ